MKTPLMFRQMIANPRRTTLAHLGDATGTDTMEALAGAVAATGPLPVMAPAGGDGGLPPSTANPRRTVLDELPKVPAAS